MTRGLWLAFLISSFTLLSCTSRGIGYGLMLWSPNPSVIPNGAVVLIKNEARTKKEYTLAYNSQELVVETWRVSFHHLKNDALKEGERFAKVQNIFAESLKAELPVRSTMDNYSNNNILYRLGEGEIAKVISEPSKEIKLGNLTGRWYEIVSQNGYRGFVFNYYLYVFDNQSNSSHAKTSLEIDPCVAKLNSWANKTWYPYYYSFMSRNRAIVLPLFNLSYGLAFLPHQKKILLTLPTLQLQISYLNTLSQNSNEIVFIEPQVRIEEVNSQELRVHFHYAQKNYCETFITFAGDIKALRERQEKELERLWSNLSLKRKFVSETAGQLILNPDNTYEWKKPTNFESILPVNLEEAGNFDLDKSMVSSLQNSYKAVLTLYPLNGKEQKASQAISFLLDYSPNFLQLVYIPKEDFYYGVATKESLNPPSFTFKREELE